jgi:hypothetical protein
MFENPSFRVYGIDEVPLNCDCFVIDERYMAEYEQSWLRMFAGGKFEDPIGYVTAVAIRHITASTLETSWIPNYFDRYHEVPILIPKDAIRACVDCWDYKETPHIFVDSSWLEQLFLRTHSVFGYVDAIGIKKAIASGTLGLDALAQLRSAIDEVSATYPDILFVSFGDNLLLKSNWTVGYFPRKQPNTYRPERLILLIRDLQSVYRSILNMDIYAIFTQGGNEFYGEASYHISKSNNHICLNCLGLSFAHLFDIDNAVRDAIRHDKHNRFELYLDAPFFASLNRHSDYGKANRPLFTYTRKMLKTDGEYIAVNCKDLIDHIDMQK